MNIGIIGGAGDSTSVFIASTTLLPVEQILFLVILSLLLVHEMDAIRAKEWKMFVVLKDITEETAYRVFTFIHFPLYLAAFYVLFCNGVTASDVLKIMIDIFLVFHAFVHYAFRKHRNNGFHTWFSKINIYSMAALALLHLCLLLAF